MKVNESPIKLSIIIVIFNDRKVLIPCLKSIYSFPNDFPLEVILVDNGSKDGSIEAVQSQFPDAKIVEAGYNSGYAGGNNIGFRHSRGRFVLFLNPDTLIHPGALDQLIQFAENTPGCGAVGPNVRQPDGSLQISCWRKKNIWDYFYETFMIHCIPILSELFKFGIYSPKKFENIMEVDTLSGCCFLVLSEVIKIIGGFDEEFFIYSEETDLCERIQKGGYKLFYTPQAVITHLGGSTTVKQKAWFLIQFEKSRRRFFKKNRRKIDEIVVRPLIVLQTFRRLVFYLVKQMISRNQSSQDSEMFQAYSKLMLWMFGFVSQGSKPK